MPRLYRNARYLDHWFLFENSQGWVKFPARQNGWTERLPARDFRLSDLNAVPLWLAFGTGMLDSARVRRARRAA